MEFARPATEGSLVCDVGWHRLELLTHVVGADGAGVDFGPAADEVTHVLLLHLVGIVGEGGGGGVEDSPACPTDGFGGDWLLSMRIVIFTHCFKK